MLLVFCVLTIFQNCFGLLLSSEGRVALKNVNLVDLRADEYFELAVLYFDQCVGSRDRFAFLKSFLSVSKSFEVAVIPGRVAFKENST